MNSLLIATACFYMQQQVPVVTSRVIVENPALSAYAYVPPANGQVFDLTVCDSYRTKAPFEE